MSAPNKAYDPVEVAALAPAEVQRREADALSAIAAARDLDQLKAARIAHAGDRSPLALARAEIGALPPAARAEAGKRVGAALAAVRASLSERQAQLEAERDQRVLVEEAVDERDELQAERLERLVPLAVPVGVRDDVDGRGHGGQATRRLPAGTGRAISQPSSKGRGP